MKPICDDDRHAHDRLLARRAYVLSIVGVVLGSFGFVLSLSHIATLL